MKPAAVNASPLIVLARAGYFNSLPKILSPIVVPRAVADEINAGPVEDPAITALYLSFSHMSGARRAQLSDQSYWLSGFGSGALITNS